MASTSAITKEIHIVADYLLNSKLYGVSSAYRLLFWEKVVAQAELREKQKGKA